MKVANSTPNSEPNSEPNAGLDAAPTIAPSIAPNLALDHLVVAAATLEQGVAWCQHTLGVTPGPGGEHALMGTHNRLLNVATPGFALAYLEIIAINPAATFSAPGHKRWFDLDNPALQSRLAADGPQLIHWVARSTALNLHRQRFIALGVQPGEPVAASRPTPAGLLQWQMVLRPDGLLLHRGAVPTLIQWQGPHPVLNMPASGVTLQGLQLAGALPAGVQNLLRMPALRCAEDSQKPVLTVTLHTPLGERSLSSPL